MWFVSEVLLAGLAVAALFIFLADYAALAGRTDARNDAGKGFRDKPSVVIHSRVKIAHNVPGITVKDQGGGSGPYRFRYSGFVTLAKTPTHFYLVSRNWHSGKVVLVLPDDGTLRAEMRPA
ncbi:hypothetical protein [Streptomyces sp. NPDC058457]|uniref:hypothetical protein n=1 Tax=Streptomyces sp. NPDC058457 TaxID=3346507 RepID=UPI003663855E